MKELSKAQAGVLAGLVLLCAVTVYPGWKDFSSAPRWMLLSAALPVLAAWAGLRPSKLAWVLLAFAGASVVWSVVAWEALNGLWTLILLLISLGLGTKLNSEGFSLLFVAAALGLIVNSLSVTAQTAFAFWLPDTPEVRDVAALLQSGPWAAWVFPAWLHGHPGGLFFNKNMLGEAAALVLCWAAYERRWVLFAGVLPCLVLTASKGAVAGLLAGAFAAVLPRAWPLAAGAALGAAWWLNPSSADVRWELWEATIVGHGAKPWGHGIGQFYALLPAFLSDTLVSRPDHAHNVFLEALFELGVLGFAAYVYIAALALVRSSGVHHSLAACLLVLSLVGFPQYTPFALLLGGIVLGGALHLRGRVCDPELVRQHAAYPGRVYQRRAAGNTQWEGVSHELSAAPRGGRP